MITPRRACHEDNDAPERKAETEFTFSQNLHQLQLQRREHLVFLYKVLSSLQLFLQSLRRRSSTISLLI